MYRLTNAFSFGERFSFVFSVSDGTYHFRSFTYIWQELKDLLCFVSMEVATLGEHFLLSLALRLNFQNKN